MSYAPDPVTNATADLTIFLPLGALRRLNPALNALRRGDFKKVGRAVKRRAEPIGLNVVYHNRKPLPVEDAAGAEYLTFGKLLQQSDIISLHVPLTPATRHLIKAAQIAMMKPGVVLDNTARGAIIDETAMAEALDKVHIGSVGLDVYEEETKIHERLLKNEKALLVPHLGTHTTETLAKMEALAMENAKRGLLGEQLLTIVSEQLRA